MTNAISQYGRLAQAEGFSRAADKTDKKTGSLISSAGAAVGASALSGAAPAPQEGDVLSLSNVSERLKAEPDFDRVKVDAIKHAIQNGQYPLNPRRIAESFVAIEQMIRD